MRRVSNVKNTTKKIGRERDFLCARKIEKGREGERERERERERDEEQGR
jgi:hypothetical protein